MPIAWKCRGGDVTLVLAMVLVTVYFFNEEFGESKRKSQQRWLKASPYVALPRKGWQRQHTAVARFYGIYNIMGFLKYYTLSSRRTLGLLRDCHINGIQNVWSMLQLMNART
ncbi:hypothetical protein M0804_000256 [Polistes exclamans]|nr:hypothetical protein M0804_000256 [Polistes exclamans]